jgi:flagellar L-ring protein FlgH
MIHKRMVIYAASVVLALAPCASAGSIWAKASMGGAVPKVYTDDIARQVGDILTVIITERSTVTNDTKNSSEKKSDRALTASGTVQLNDIRQWMGQSGNGRFTMPTIGATSSADNKFEGTADFASDRSMTDRITLTVHDVLPNGNLVIVGTRLRNTQGNVQIVCLSGVVRPSDITYANTILSEQVADFHLVTVVKGPENSFTEPNWLGRILNVAAPW